MADNYIKYDWGELIWVQAETKTDIMDNDLHICKYKNMYIDPICITFHSHAHKHKYAKILALPSQE